MDGGAGPRGVAVGVGEEVAVGADDGDHDRVVDEAAEDGAVDLREEHDARGDLEVFALLEVVAKGHAVGDDVVRPCCEVHVADGAVGKDETSDQLGEVVGCDTIAVAGVEDCGL